MTFKKIAVMVTLGVLIALYVVFDLNRFFSLDYLKSSQQSFERLYAGQPLKVITLYFVVYVAVTALSFPGAVILTLAGGAIFGLGWGTLIISFASSVGATLAFLMARFVLRDSIEARFGPRLAEFNQGLEKEGAFYLFSLRLVPLVPFFVINLLMGLTQMKVSTYYWVSQLGMLAGTLVYVNAGTQLGQLDSLQGILSPALLGSFVLLGFFPLLARQVASRLQQRQVFARWKHLKPKAFDRNLIVIGGGAGGWSAPTLPQWSKPKSHWSKPTSWGATASTMVACQAKRSSKARGSRTRCSTHRATDSRTARPPSVSKP